MWMDLETVILSEDSQTEKVKYDITYMCNLKENDTKGLIYKTETDSQFREQTWLLAGVGGKEGKGSVRKFGTDMDTPLYLK